ncbi:MAG: PKD domain-containing protein, partial [Methanolinea sp.]
IFVVIVVVFIFFPLQPDVVPSLSATVERSGNVVYIYHDGGDPLPRGKTLVRVNGRVMPDSSLSFLYSQDWPWTPGKTLRVQYDGPGTPDLVEVVYSGQKGEAVIFESRAPAGPTPPGPVSTVETTPPAASPAPSPAGTPLLATLIPVVTFTPTGTPQAEPPRAEFTAEPTAGRVPLVVRFTDHSSGVPTSWLWNFGDGESSTEQNPVHEYRSPGVYTVALTVRNAYGTGQKVERDLVKAGTVPTAQFAAIPSEGEAPLTVQFNDLSRGLPTDYSWDFGDGSGSRAKNPVHTYTREGEYTVSLTVSNQFGSDTRIQSGAVKVAAAKKVDISLRGSRKGSLSTGYIQFSVGGKGGWMKIGGYTHAFSPGDLVQVFVDRTDSGHVDVNAHGFTGLKFDSARLYVNGNHAQSGIVSDVNVPSFSGFFTTFTIEIPPDDQTMVLFVNEGKVIPAPDRKIVIGNLCENSAGQMNLEFVRGSLNYRGGARSFSVTPVK